MVELGVNIDHVATLRQARGGVEPDILQAAREAELGGADGITIHLREDRRHIQDADVAALRAAVATRLNLELSLSEEILRIALLTHPDQATLVPERRQEITTEGGLDLKSSPDRIARAVRLLRDGGIFTSAFIDPDLSQVKAAADLGFQAIELHTGAYAGAAPGSALKQQLNALQAASAEALRLGLRLHAGHGLNYANTPAIARIPGMFELNIGHSLVSHAVYMGLRASVRRMKDILAAI